MDPLGYGDPLVLSYVMIAVSLAIGIALAVLWIWMIRECATKEPSQVKTKLLWLAFIVLVPGFGALTYFIVRRPERIHDHGV